MTKVIKWWKKVSFWFKLKGILLSFGIGSEIGLYFGEQDGHGWKIFVGITTAAAMLITHLIEDKDNNGIVDWFQKTRRKP